MLQFFTPSYAPDLGRLLLLRESIERLCREPARHIIAVPTEDVPLFRQRLRGEGVEVIAQSAFVDEDMFPPRWYRMVKRTFPGQLWRFARAAGPGGWFIQQLVKLNSCLIYQQGPIHFLDSDLAFIRPFDSRDFGCERDRILVRKLVRADGGAEWPGYLMSARNLVGLPPGPTDFNYNNNPPVLYGEVLPKLHDRLETVNGAPWQSVLRHFFESREEKFLSEYCIHGVFLEEVLRPANLVVDSTQRFLEVWEAHAYESVMEQLRKDAAYEDRPLPLGLNVQSNTGITEHAYAEFLRDIWRATDHRESRRVPAHTPTL